MNRSMFVLPTLLLLLSVTLPSFTLAQTGTRFGTVSTTELNLRPEAATGNTPIARLKSGDILAILEEREGWLRVRTLVTGQTGWVSSKYVNGLTAAANQEEATSVAPRPMLRLPEPLLVSVTNFSCEESIFDDDGGYKGCTVEMSVTIEIPHLYAKFVKDSIDLRCSTTVEYKTLEGFIEQTSSENSYAYVSIYDGSGYERVTMEHSFGFNFDPVVRARLGEASCDFS